MMPMCGLVKILVLHGEKLMQDYLTVGLHVLLLIHTMMLLHMLLFQAINMVIMLLIFLEPQIMVKHG